MSWHIFHCWSMWCRFSVRKNGFCSSLNTCFVHHLSANHTHDLMSCRAREYIKYKSITYSNAPRIKSWALTSNGSSSPYLCLMVVCVFSEPEYDFGQTPEFHTIRLGCRVCCQVGMMDIRGCKHIRVSSRQEYCSLGVKVGQRTCEKI